MVRAFVVVDRLESLEFDRSFGADLVSHKTKGVIDLPVNPVSHFHHGAREVLNALVQPRRPIATPPRGVKFGVVVDRILALVLAKNKEGRAVFDSEEGFLLLDIIARA